MLWIRLYGRLCPNQTRVLRTVFQSQSRSEGVVRNRASRRQRTTPILVQAAFAATFATCGLIALSGPAEAQAPGQKGKAQQAKASPPAPVINSPLVAIVSIGRQRVTFYDKHGAVAQSPISSGRSGNDTPQGVFSIIEKKEEHFSNIYDDAPMPFMQRITWSGVAMHAGNLPGYPASHGCIRLPYGFAERLFKMTKMNTRVVVMQGEVAPMSIVHPALFQPRLAEVAAAPASTTVAPGVEVIESSKPRPELPAGAVEGDTPMMLGGRLAKPNVAEATDSATKPQKATLTPLEAARAQKLAAAEKLTAAIKFADATKLAHKVAMTDATKAYRGIGPADAAQRRADAKAAQLERQIALAKTEELSEKAKLAHATAVAEALAAAKAAVDAKALHAERQAKIKASLEAAKDAEKARVAANVEAKVSERLSEPVSVFVSRKTSRVYIRQGRIAVADMPVTIKDPQRAIGTHVFTAVDAADGGRRVAWNVVNVQSPAEAAVPVQTQKGKGQQQPAAKPVTPTAAVVGAQALERIEFPEAALARITPYIQMGSSLIISDLGLSVETGQGTDFVVQTRGEAESIVSQQKYARERGIKVSRNN